MFLRTTRPEAAVLPSAGVEKAELCRQQEALTLLVCSRAPGAYLEPPRAHVSTATAPSPLTPMHAEVTAVLVQGFQRGDIRSSRSNLIHPLDGLHHFVPLLLCKDGGTLVLGNLLWGRNKIPVRSMSGSYSDSQSLPLSFHGQVNFTAGLSSDLDQSVVAKEAPARSEKILIWLHFLKI